MFDMQALEPRTENNVELEANVHPRDWKNPTPRGVYDLVVIGAGTAGLVTAAGAAGLGARVALVERELMGGDCLNVGCVPSKGIIRAARAAHSVRQAHHFGVRGTTSVDVNFAMAMEEMRRLRAKISPNDSAERFANLGVDVFFGSARFEDGQVVDVNGRPLRYRRAVIASGARAAAPPIPGLDTIPYLTNETVFSLTELPCRFGIIGAGPIGCELAQSFARFGSEVFLVEAGERILPREDQDAATVVSRSLQQDGVHLLCGGKELTVSPADGGAILLKGEADCGVYTQVVDQLLVAVGRSPNIEDLQLEKVGVDCNAAGVIVNDHLQTTNSRIYAAGDVASRYKFTHAADFMARIVIRNALLPRFAGRGKASKMLIPWCTYTSPEVAHVGLYPGQADALGVAIDTYIQQFEDVDRAILDCETQGFVKVHVKRGTDRIVGATIVAGHAGDMISEITLAMQHGIGLKKIGETIHPYPTQAEAIRKLGDKFNRSRLTPFAKSFLRRLIALRGN